MKEEKSNSKSLDKAEATDGRELSWSSAELVLAGDSCLIAPVHAAVDLEKDAKLQPKTASFEELFRAFVNYLFSLSSTSRRKNNLSLLYSVYPALVINYYRLASWFSVKR